MGGNNSHQEQLVDQTGLKTLKGNSNIKLKERICNLQKQIKIIHEFTLTNQNY